MQQKLMLKHNNYNQNNNKSSICFKLRLHDDIFTLKENTPQHAAVQMFQGIHSFAIVIEDIKKCQYFD